MRNEQTRGSRDEVERLRKALAFYADHRNHSGVGVSRVYCDGGRMARQVLGECQTCSGLGEVKTGERGFDQDGPYDVWDRCPACHRSGFEDGRVVPA